MSKTLIQVYSRNMNRVEEQIKLLTTNKEITSTIKKPNYILIETDASMYRGQIFNQSLRGNRYTDVWIDKKTNYNDEEIELITMKVIPQYIRKELSEEEYKNKLNDYKWKEHVHYFE